MSARAWRPAEGEQRALTNDELAASLLGVLRAFDVARKGMAGSLALACLSEGQRSKLNRAQALVSEAAARLTGDAACAEGVHRTATAARDTIAAMRLAAKDAHRRGQYYDEGPGGLIPQEVALSHHELLLALKRIVSIAETFGVRS